MTNEMRERVIKAIEVSNGALTVEFCKEAIAQRERTVAYYNSLPSWQQGYNAKREITVAQSEIAYYEAVIEVLAEQAAAVVVAETVEVLAAIVTVVNKTKAVRKAVATLANKFHRLGYTLSDSFKRAWQLTRAFKGLLPSLA